MQFAFRTFGRGTHPPARKITAGVPLADFDVPERLFVPLSQHVGAPASAAVKSGDPVAVGQCIGESGGFISARVHSPVSGTVESMAELPVPSGGKCLHALIVNDFEYRTAYLPPLEDPAPESIRERVRECGIVGMGGAGFPTHVKLAPKNKIDYFLVNGAECEPYITCDCRLMAERADEVVRGAELLAAATGAECALIGVESNKKEAFAALETACARLGGAKVKPVLLRTKYPQGAEKQLVYALTGRKVPPGPLPGPWTAASLLSRAP